ncbi:hypothetical protein [Ornithinibacillus caprae]|nr:hypothetical protein [Ornithinibacillus caprae]
MKLAEGSRGKESIPAKQNSIESGMNKLLICKTIFLNGWWSL